MIAKHLWVLTTLICISLLSGCATTPDSSNAENQRMAIQRWQACIERNTSDSTNTLNGVQQLMEYKCEGHTRDVIATFPRHQEKQIDQLLTGYVIRHALTNVPNSEASALVPVLF